MSWLARLFQRQPRPAQPSAPKPALLRLQDGEPVTDDELAAFFTLKDQEQLEEIRRWSGRERHSP